MNYTKTNRDGITFVDIKQKQATSETANEFRTYLVDLIEKGNVKQLVINFDEVEFVDSSFLGALVTGLKKINSIKGDIKVMNLQAPVRALFELTRLYKVFEIFDHEEDAVLSF